MKTSLVFLSMCLFLISPSWGQHNLMQDIDSYKRAADRSPAQANIFREKRKRISISDSTFLITGRVLMHLDADAYKITLSLNQEAVTIKESMDLIDARIEKFIKSLEKQGITRSATYIDLTGQYPVYGYDIERKTATQQLQGYEVNKNIIIRYEELSMTEQLMEIAAEHGIHDAAKIEYIIHDTESLYEQLFSEALKIINRKKRLYLAATNLNIQNEAMVHSEQFQFVFPQERYKQYQAFESTELKGSRSKKLREEERKKTTHYYEGMNFSGFDKIIDPDKVQVGLQLIFELQLKYEREK